MEDESIRQLPTTLEEWCCKVDIPLSAPIFGTLCVAWDAACRAEREACAKVCEDLQRGYAQDEVSGTDCAEAIRSRTPQRQP